MSRTGKPEDTAQVWPPPLPEAFAGQEKSRGPLSLRLFQFRCHPELKLQIGRGRHYFLGANGRGKTSILEALYFLSRLRSWRTPHVRELPQWRCGQFRIEARFDDEHLCATWQASGRELLLGGEPAGSVADFWGRLPTVLMVGEDRDLIVGPGARRRQWIDGLLAHRDPGYISLAQQYQRAVKQRNAWLRQCAEDPHKADPELGRSLTELVTQRGLEVTRQRAALSERLAPVLRLLYSNLMGEDERLSIRYHPSFPMPSGGDSKSASGELEAAPDWDRVADAEARMHTTQLGPHRDDWKIERAAHGLARYGSEGQQRAAALAFRLAEAALIRERRGGWPILLMDDVAPQLDEQKQTALKKLLPADADILLTAPEHRGWAQPQDTLWSVAPGEINQAVN